MPPSRCGDNTPLALSICMGLECSGGSLKTCEQFGARAAVNHDPCTFNVTLRTKLRAVVCNKPRESLHCTRAEPQLQELIVGGAVLTAVTAAIVNGFKVCMSAECCRSPFSPSA